MNMIIISFFIGISLGVDAFTLALSLGTMNYKTLKIIVLSTMIGLFHFLMPQIGYQIGNVINKKMIINTNFFTSLIFFFLAYEMIKNKDEQYNLILNNNFSLILLALSVSIDSLSLGIVLGLKEGNVLLAGLIFSIISFLMTILGFYFGIKFQQHNRECAINIGIIVMTVLALKNLFGI